MIKSYSRILILSLIILFSFSSLCEFESSSKGNLREKNIIFNENKDEHNLPYSKISDLTQNNEYSGIGSPWNVTHWANGTFQNTDIAFNEGSSDIVEMYVGEDPWKGYRLDAVLKDIYDSRNWCNGTYDFGAPWGSQIIGDNDSDGTIISNNQFQNWTFHTRDLGITPNTMSGNYLGSASDGYFELYMRNSTAYIPDTGTGYDFWYHYDAGDSAMWNSSLNVERGRLVDCTIQFDVQPIWVISAPVFFIAIYINNIKTYSISTQEIEQMYGNGWTTLTIPMVQWTNQTNIFSGPLNETGDIPVSIALEALGSNSRIGGDEREQRVYIDNFQIIPKAEVKPYQIGLKLNSTSVNSINWGKGELEVEPITKWRSFNGSANLNFDCTDAGLLGPYNIEAKMDSNFYIFKNALDTNYETNEASIGTRFSTDNISKVEWLAYDYLEVPDGYVQDNLTILFPADYNITGVFEPQFQKINRISQCELSTRGLIKVAVLSISSTPDGFWRFEAQGPNYCKALDIYNNKSGIWEHTNTIQAGQYINIRVNISTSNSYVDISDYVDQTYAQLSIRLPNGTIWMEQNQQVQVNTEGFLNFTTFELPSETSQIYMVGEYETIVTWNNSYSSFECNESGIITSKFIVIHDSLLIADQNQYFFNNVVENSIINLRVIFRDKINNDPILGAEVYTYELPYPTGNRHYFSEISSGYYFLEFNVSGASIGNTTFTINANSTLYENNKLNFTVFVIKETEIKTLEYPLIQSYWRENFTIHLNYTEKDTSIGIDGIITHDWNGEIFIKSIVTGIYNITCNTSNYAVNKLHNITINIGKFGYQNKSITINIEILERQTFIDSVHLNGIEGLSISINSGELLNITLKYKDQIASGEFIKNASVRLLGEGINKSINENLLLLQYNFTLNTAELEVGVNYLTIKAQRNNFTTSTKKISVIINVIPTDFRLYIEQANHTDGSLFSIDVDQDINITAKFVNKISGDPIFGADASLEDFINLDPHPIFPQYNVTINTNIFGEGVSILTLKIALNGYETISFKFSIKVNKKDSNLTLYLDGVEKTNEPSIDIDYGTNVNLTIFFVDNQTKYHISGATISLNGKGISDSFGELVNQYYYNLDTKQMNIGITFITIFAQRNNYQEVTLLLRVNVERLQGVIQLVDEDKDAINSLADQNVEIKIKLYEIVSDAPITGAKVKYTWELGAGEFEETDTPGVYTTTLKNVTAGSYIITITVDAGDIYEFERFEISLDSIVPSEDNLLFLVLAIIVGCCAVGIAIYTILYIKIFQYPKPVRKTRKFKKTLDKADAPKKEITTRNATIMELYGSPLSKISKKVKVVPIDKGIADRMKEKLHEDLKEDGGDSPK